MITRQRATLAIAALLLGVLVFLVVPDAARDRSGRADSYRSPAPVSDHTEATPPAPGEHVRHDSRNSSWKSGRPQDAGCQGISDTMRPVSPSKAARVPDNWLLMLLRCHCMNRLSLSESEIAAILGAIKSDVVSILEHPDHADQHAACVLNLLAARPDVMPAGSWGRALAVAGKASDSGIFRADTDVLIVARKLLGAHSPQDETWWKQLWEGLPETLRAVAARRAVYEAVRLDVEPAERLAAWSMMAGFEDTASPSANRGLLALGMTMRAHLDGSAVLDWMARADDPNWKRALLWSLDHAALWPQREQPLTDVVARTILETLKSQPQSPNERYWRLDLIGRSWGVLGPTIASREFAEYTVRPEGDVYEAVLRVVVVAYEISQHEESTRPEDQKAFDEAEAALANFVAAGRYSHLIERALKRPKMQGRGPRDVLVRALGPTVRTLPKRVYTRLVR